MYILIITMILVTKTQLRRHSELLIPTDQPCCSVAFHQRRITCINDSTLWPANVPTLYQVNCMGGLDLISWRHNQAPAIICYELTIISGNELKSQFRYSIRRIMLFIKYNIATYTYYYISTMWISESCTFYYQTSRTTANP